MAGSDKRKHSLLFIQTPFRGKIVKGEKLAFAPVPGSIIQKYWGNWENRKIPS